MAGRGVGGHTSVFPTDRDLESHETVAGRDCWAAFGAVLPNSRLRASEQTPVYGQHTSHFPRDRSMWWRQVEKRRLRWVVSSETGSDKGA